ncbi:hypothetical protein [Rhodanobacter lindaniclasticus]
MRFASSAAARCGWSIPCRRAALLLAACLLWPPGCFATTDPDVFAVGVGMQRMPRLARRKQPAQRTGPYLDIDLPGRGSFSTLDGLQIDLIHGSSWHGGIHGDYQWGRPATTSAACAERSRRCRRG